MLADHQIRYEIENVGLRSNIYVFPYVPSMVQPASLDMRLGSTFVRYGRSSDPIDPENPVDSDLAKFNADKLVLYPGEFVLGATLERIGIGPTIAARVEGKSTLGRLGLIVHSTAGFIDPGFEGSITLEMTNINTRPIILRTGMKICQIAFYRMDAPAEFPYGHESLGSHYQSQIDVTPAAILKTMTLFS